MKLNGRVKSLPQKGIDKCRIFDFPKKFIIFLMIIMKFLIIARKMVTLALK
jgi:hypothetical protein